MTTECHSTLCATPAIPEPLAWFADMIDHCYDYAEAAKAAGRPVVGIMCEFTPRELILAAGGVPVCLCGGSGETIPAAEQSLPANLCPLIKSTFGYHVTGRNPFLKWADLVVAETTCDGKKKMFELLGESKPMHVLELPHKADDPDALEHWTAEVRKLKQALEARFGVTITDEKLRDAIRLMNRERGLRRQLADLMTHERPPLTGRQLIEFKSIISGIEADLRQYERALELYGSGAGAPPALVSADASSAVSCGNRENNPHHGRQTGAPHDLRQPPRPVRVLLTGVPLVHGAERVLELIESCGAVVVCMENCTGLKPILDDVDESDPDPLRAIARKYYHLPCSVLTKNTRRFESLRALAAKFRPDCVIELIWQACLTYDVESFQVRRLSEEELHLPYLKITTDYSPSDSARILARVEALVEMVRAEPTNQANGLKH
jgi:benzoyl-CoA reductase/2-hydroxyglutaryl-CoA dehydratase subunit BcrC/BadD/HgdB